MKQASLEVAFTGLSLAFIITWSAYNKINSCIERSQIPQFTSTSPVFRVIRAANGESLFVVVGCSMLSELVLRLCRVSTCQHPTSLIQFLFTLVQAGSSQSVHWLGYEMGQLKYRSSIPSRGKDFHFPTGSRPVCNGCRRGPSRGGGRGREARMCG
jgi:hypothetical protein